MPKEQQIVNFSGTVQGVGFRYTASRAAGGFDITGTVRNLPDGKVEAIIEGDADEINAFLTELADRMSGYIRRQTSQKAPYSGKFNSFDVRY